MTIFKASLVAIGFSLNFSDAVYAMEIPCSHEFVQRWRERDAAGNPIYFEKIRITVAPDFDAIDAEHSIDRSRPNYLSLQIVAHLRTANGRDVSVLGDIFYGYVDGGFRPQQLFFEHEIGSAALDQFPLLRCELGSV